MISTIGMPNSSTYHNIVQIVVVFRYGRGGRNYGKQTRIWDVLFGTVAPREEEAIYALSVGLKEV